MKYFVLLLLLAGCTGSYIADDISSMEFSSPAFQDQGMIPAKYTCDGADVSPPFTLSSVPSNVVSLAIEMTDYDAPSGEFNHWVIWNINPTGSLPEGSVPVGAVQGVNGFGKNQYSGPCPPSGVHSYRFRIYGLDEKLSLPATANDDDFGLAIDGHVLHVAETWGRYGR